MKPLNIPHRREKLHRRATHAVHDALMALNSWGWRHLAGMDIGRDTKIALRTYLDLANPKGVHIGDGTKVAYKASIMAHELSRHLHMNTYIGRNCYIGARAVIMPGVRIGDQSIVVEGSVVTKDVPAGSMIIGHPGRIVRSGLRTGRHGFLLDADQDAGAPETQDSLEESTVKLCIKCGEPNLSVSREPVIYSGVNRVWTEDIWTCSRCGHSETFLVQFQIRGQDKLEEASLMSNSPP